MDIPAVPPEFSALLYELLAEDYDISGFLDSLAQLCAVQLSDQDHVLCGIVLERSKKNVVVASSSEQAARLDEVQAGFDEGPCLEAQRKGVTIRVPDVHHEKRWPRYMAVIRDQGLRSALAIPLITNDQTRAAMNFYTTKPSAFNEDEIKLAHSYANLATQVVTIALRIASNAEAAADRRKAMESRTSIDLAVGIIMGQNGCSQDEAFEILTRASSNRHTKLKTLAEQLITSMGHGPATTTFDP